jgi:heme/copper-type cytochrome/quinol oxidase subunit 3
MVLSARKLCVARTCQARHLCAEQSVCGIFYILTSVHALHVVVGISALGYILLRTWEPTSDEDELTKRKQVSNTVGWFWHFMDALWIVLVLLLAFWNNLCRRLCPELKQNQSS